jgi:hypothetical protein
LKLKRVQIAGALLLAVLVLRALLLRYGAFSG